MSSVPVAKATEPFIIGGYIKMKRLVITLLLLAAAMLTSPADAWETSGKIYGTDIEYADLSVTKAGVSVRLNNTYANNVKISLRLDFYDKMGNSVGYSLFGLREIKGESYVDISNNYLSGKWKPCRDAMRIDWKLMTHEIVF